MLLDPVDELVAAYPDPAHAEPVDGQCAERPLDLRISEAHEPADLGAVQIQGWRTGFVPDETATVGLWWLRGAFRHMRQRNRRRGIAATPGGAGGGVTLGHRPRARRMGHGG